jgi:signal transduction histidine kinase
MLSDGSGAVRRIPIPVSPTQQIVRETSRQGLVVGAGLLVVGLVAAGMLANRLTRPLRRLAAGAEALGGGELGVQVPEDAPGEVGELQRAFNQMSSRLAALERERSRWLERENLAQLGDLSRGLAHTVRNPLNTLGLAIEELALDRSDQAGLAATARSQIRRIDRWLRSFLALGAADAAATEIVDLRELVQDVTLEAIQDGARIAVDGGEQPLPVRAVPSALRAALANLVENAVEASPAGQPVEVSASRVAGEALLTVADRGPGLPQAVRDRLYAPHCTTKLGGSGMGLFLAQRLIVGMHEGRLEMRDRPGGGTVAELRLRLEEDHVAAS